MTDKDVETSSRGAIEVRLLLDTAILILRGGIAGTSQ